MKLSRSDIEKIAYNSRLELVEDEIVYYKDWLSKAFDYFGKIKEVDTSNIESMTKMTEKKNVFKTDALSSQCKDEDKKPNIIDIEDGYFVVPAIIDDEQ